MDVVHRKLHRARRSCKHRLTPGNQPMVQFLPCNLNGKDTVSTWMQGVTEACNQGLGDLGSRCHRAMTLWPFSVGSTMAVPFSVCSRSSAKSGRPYRSSIIRTQSPSRAHEHSNTVRRRCLRRKERKNQVQQGRSTRTRSARRQMHRGPPRVGFPLFMMICSFLIRPRDLNCSRYGSVTVLAGSAYMFAVCVCRMCLRQLACVTCAVCNWRE